MAFWILSFALAVQLCVAEESNSEDFPIFFIPKCYGLSKENKFASPRKNPVHTLIISMDGISTSGCSAKRPSDFVVTIQPNSIDNKTYFHTVPGQHSNLLRRKGDIGEVKISFEPDSEFFHIGEFGIVVNVPEAALQHIVIENHGAHHYGDGAVQVRIPFGFTSLQSIKTVRDQPSWYQAFVLEADVSASNGDIAIEVGHPGTYTLKGDLERMEFQKDSLDQIGSTVSVEGDVQYAAISQPGNYLVNGNVAEAYVIASSDLRTVLTTTKSCANVTVDVSVSPEAECKVDPNSTIPYPALSCFAFACQLVGEVDSEGFCAYSEYCESVFTEEPTPSPTVSLSPTTATPTASPSYVLTASPTITANPTAPPSFGSTYFPSGSPSDAPSFTPSSAPSDVPSVSPSDTPSDQPSHAPSVGPTTLAPTQWPTVLPTAIPTAVPTTAIPSAIPTSGTPSAIPTTAEPTLTFTASSMLSCVKSDQQQVMKFNDATETLVISATRSDWCSSTRPSDFVISIQPRTGGGSKTRVFTIPERQENLIKTFESSANSTGVVTFKEDSQFYQLGLFGIVIEVPPEILKTIIITSAKSSKDKNTVKVRVLPGFPNLASVQTSKSTESRRPAFDFQADVTEAAEPVSFFLWHPGTYNIRGDVRLLSSVDGPFTTPNPKEAAINVNIHGDVEKIKIEKAGNYAVDGTVTKASVSGANGDTILTVTDCSNVTLKQGAECVSVDEYDLFLPAFSLECTVPVCQVVGVLGSDGETCEYEKQCESVIYLPTMSPTISPSISSGAPSAVPSLSLEPTLEPTGVPTTGTPTSVPSLSPTKMSKEEKERLRKEEREREKEEREREKAEGEKGKQGEEGKDEKNELEPSGNSTLVNSEEHHTATSTATTTSGATSVATTTTTTGATNVATTSTSGGNTRRGRNTSATNSLVRRASALVVSVTVLMVSYIFY